MAPKRKLDRSVFKEEKSSSKEEKKVKVEEPKLAGEELLLRNENGESITSHSWTHIFDIPKKQRNWLCWAYMTVDWMQALYYQKHGIRIKLSIQELVDNLNPSSPCFEYVAELPEVIDWIRKNGLSLEEDYKYTGKKQAPQQRPEGATIIRLECIDCIDTDEKQVLQCLAKMPLAAHLKYDGEVYYDMRRNYPKGVYRIRKDQYPRRDPYGTSLYHCDHGILLTGWGTDEQGTNYYKARDSNVGSAPNNGDYKVVRNQVYRAMKLVH